MRFRPRPGALFALLFPSVGLAEQAHEHGVATLEVTLDGHSLTLVLESPLDNLVGFEHPPRQTGEEAALKQMEHRLSDPKQLFSPDQAAACSIGRVQIKQPYATAARPPQVTTPPETGHEPEQHAEVMATYEWHCDHPEALRRLQVRLFEPFPGIKRVRTQTATPGGQGSATLTKSRTDLPL